MKNSNLNPKIEKNISNSVLNRNHARLCSGPGEHLRSEFDCGYDIYFYFSPMFLKNLVHTVPYSMVIQKNRQQHNKKIYKTSFLDKKVHTHHTVSPYSTIQTGVLVA